MGVSCRCFVLMCSTFSATNGFRPVGICLDARTYKHLPMTNHRKTIPTLKVEDNSAHSNDIKHAHVCNSTARPPARDSSCHVREAPNLMTRADVLNTMAAVVGVLTINAASSTAASRTAEELIRLVSDARRQLDPVDKLITDAKWDSIRTIIKTPPLAEIKNVVSELARKADDEESALLLGLRQDLLDHVQYLDSFSYNNVFVGEERQILGTKIDFDTPRMELRECREAFDIIMEALPTAE